MELCEWKTVLLNWIQQCNFLGYFPCLEDLNIEDFFIIYAQYAQITLPIQELAVCSSLHINKTQLNLNSFLQEIYPEFTSCLEYDGSMVKADYVYVFTLLLHYTCVHNPNEYFHNICKRLPESSQQYIASFFEQVVNKPRLTRQFLRQTILNVKYVIEHNVSTAESVFVSNCLPHEPSRNLLITEPPEHAIVKVIIPITSCNKNVTEVNNQSITTINTTPQTKVQTAQLFTVQSDRMPAPPPTPKSELLEQRTRELLGLRAQLETERYEKNVLEEQILENEYMINSLTKENDIKKNQLTKWKVILQSESCEDVNSLRNNIPCEFDNFKNRLLKELRNKDILLAENNETIREVKEENDKVVNKLKVSQKQLRVCMDKINELEQQLEYHTQLLVGKDDEINCLQRDKYELEHCLQETRDELHKGREVLNASSDMLNTSQSSSGINITSDNLASIVIDKQLREKELENDLLRNKLKAMAQEAKQIFDDMLKFAKIHNIEISSCSQDSQSDLLNMIGFNIKQLSMSFQQKQCLLKKQQTQHSILINQKTRLEEHIFKMKKESAFLYQKLSKSQHDLQASNDKLQRLKIENREIKINHCQEVGKKIKQLAYIQNEMIGVHGQNRSLRIRINNEVKNFVNRHQIFAEHHALNINEFNTHENDTIKKKKQGNNGHKHYNSLLRNSTESKLTQELNYNLNSVIEEKIKMKDEFKEDKTEITDNTFELEHQLNNICQEFINETEHIKKDFQIDNRTQAHLDLDLRTSTEENIDSEQKQENIQSFLHAIQQYPDQMDTRKFKNQVNEGIANEKALIFLQEKLAKKEEELQNSKTQLNLTTKRLEKMAVRLGEQQANIIKEQRQIELSKSDFVGQVKLLYEKDTLQSKMRRNEERANRAEEKLVGLEGKLYSMEKEREVMNARRISLENGRDTAVKMLRDLQKQEQLAEQQKVRFSLEIGGLNSEIVLEKKRTAQLIAQLQLACDSLAEICQSLLAQGNCQNTEFCLMKSNSMTHQLNVLHRHLSKSLQELNDRRCEDAFLKRDQVELAEEQDKRTITDKLEFETKEILGAQYQKELNTLQWKLDKCMAELFEVRVSRDGLLNTLRKEANSSEKNQIVPYREKAQQLELDCQILQAKYRGAKDEIGSFEKKIKENRLEMEGKLEKMKSKMRTLYTAEITRMKEKQDRDSANHKKELDKLNAKNIKYEEHTQKLSNQIMLLNERILEHQKQHVFLTNKLRNFQETESTASTVADVWYTFKRPSAPSVNLGSNLAMEDEEGEVFNNTYLTDLKLGRVSGLRAGEVQYRNSLQPPHLKSTYAAQYDLDALDDYFKDGSQSMDDSLSALIKPTADVGIGARKKSVGTHYKRPGPPTPSKNGGRLSFGNSDPLKEMLRETMDSNGPTKTPACFKMFSSRFSVGNNGKQFTSRDEEPYNRQHIMLESMQLNTRKAFCTSTPRKCMFYHDKQRIITQYDAALESQCQSDLLENVLYLPSTSMLPMTCGSKRMLSSNRMLETSTKSISSETCDDNKIHKRRKRSLCVKFNETNVHSKQCLLKKKRQQRHEFFDQARNLYVKDFKSDIMAKHIEEKTALHALDNSNTYNNCNDSFLIMGTNVLPKNDIKSNIEFKSAPVFKQNIDILNVCNMSTMPSKTFQLKWTEGQQKLLLNALDATDGYEHTSNSILQHQINYNICNSVCNVSCSFDKDFGDSFYLNELMYQINSTTSFVSRGLTYNPTENQMNRKRNENTISPKQTYTCKISAKISKSYCNSKASPMQWNMYPLSHKQTHCLPRINITIMQRLSDGNVSPKTMQSYFWYRRCATIVISFLLLLYSLYIFLK